MSCTPCIPSQPKQKCGEKERCSLCQCGKIDARICLPCKHKYCHTCVDKLVPPDSPQTFASCPICTMNPECLKVCYPPKADPCAAPQFGCNNNAPCDEWYCYNCFSEGNCKVRAKEFCLDCDVSMCDKHLCQHKSFIKRKKHTLMPVCQYKLMKRKFEVRRCKVHPKHTLLFVCQKCDQIVCQICCACNLCDAGGRHDAQELEIVALDIASAINSNIKDIDCFRRSGEKQIEDGFKFYQCNENDLEKLKQRVCAIFEEKNIELARDKQCILAKCNELICQNRKAVQSNKAEINNILCEAKNVAARANQLLQYSHNVDIATESRNMLNELQSAKAVAFPILQLGKFKLCAQEKALEIPSLVQECEALSAPPCPPPCNPCPPACPPPCSPCTPCPPPCSPCPPCPPPCNPCKPPCNPCPPACPPPCSPCPTPPCDPCYSPCPPPSQPCTPSPCPPCPENSYLETTFRFQIDDPFSLQTAYSKMFYVKDLPWNLMAERRTVKRCDVDCNEYLAFFLQCNKNSCDQCWCCEANAELRLINQCNEGNSFCRKIQHRFSPEEKDWGYSTYIKWCDAMDSSNGFYKNNKLVLEVHVVASCS